MTLDVLSYLLRTGTVGLAAALLLFLVRRRSAAVQHALAASGLIAMLVLAPASFVLTHRIKPAYSTPVPVSVGVPSGEPEPVHADSPAKQSAESEPNLKPAELATVKEPAGHSVGPWRRWAAGTDPSKLFAYAWAVVSMLACLRLIAALITVSKRVSRAEPVGQLISQTNEFLAARIRFERLDIRVDRATKVPLAVWWGRRVVLLPSSWASWSSERLETVLRHEIAHLDRGDCWIQLCASVACVLAWPNPLAWWLLRKTRNLSEQAVDDLILQSGIAPSRYAQDLLDIAQQSRDRLAGMLFPMSMKPEVSRRIEMILNDRKQRGAATLAAMVTMGLGFGGLAVCLSRWGLVPTQTASTIGKALSKAIPSVGLDRVSEQDSPPPLMDSEPSGFRTESAPVAGVAELPKSVEPSFANEDARSGHPAEILGGEEYRHIETELYFLGPDTDLSHFGIRLKEGQTTREPYVPADQAEALFADLSRQGAECKFRSWQNLMFEHPFPMTVGVKPRAPIWNVRASYVRQPIATSDVVYQVAKRVGTNSETPYFVAILPPEKVTVVVRPRGASKEGYELWLMRPWGLHHMPPALAPHDSGAHVLPAVSGEQTVALSTVPTAAAALPDHKYKVLAELYEVDTSANHGVFDIGIPPYYRNGSMSVGVGQLPDLQGRLGQATARRLGSYSAESSDDDLSEIIPDASLGVPPLILALRQHENGSTTMLVGVRSTKSDGAGSSRMAFRVPAGRAAYAIWIDPDAGGRFFLWLFDLQVRPVVLHSVAAPTSVSPSIAGRPVVFGVEQYSLPAGYEDSLHLRSDPGKQHEVYAETLSEYSTSVLKRLLREGPAKLDSAPVIPSLFDSPTLCASVVDGVESRLELNLNEKYVLSTHIRQQSDEPRWSRTFDSSSLVRPGGSRVIVGLPEPMTNTTPLWIITVGSGGDPKPAAH